MAAKIDTSKIKAAIQEMRMIPKKEGPDVLNKSILQVAIGSGSGKGLVQLTKKATQERIQEDMMQIVTTTGKRGGSHSAARVVVLAAQWLRDKQGITGPKSWKPDDQLYWRSQISAACEKIIKARVKSRAFIAAGWLWAAKDIAPKVKGAKLSRMEPKNVPMLSGGEAADSYGREAQPQSLFAGVYNAAKGTEVICTSGVLQSALDGEARNIHQYLVQAFHKAIKQSAKLKVST